MPRVSKGTRKYAKTKQAELPSKFQAGFISTLDGRTELARGLKERFDSIASDLGGLSELSYIKASLLERFIWLEASIAQLESDLVAPSDEPKARGEMMARYINAINTFANIARTLSLERKIKSSPWAEVSK